MSAALLLAACGDEDAGAPGGAGGTGGAGAGGTGGTGGSIWDALEELKTALEASPDHREAEARRVVASGDPEKIFGFVRDSIAVLPRVQASTDDESHQRWGARATLRGGAGTMRERAELLAGLLNEAGFKASVVAGFASEALRTREARAAIFGPRVRTFEPGPAPAGGWAASLPRKEELPTVDTAAASALADKLLALLPAGAIQAVDDGVPELNRVPLVSFEQGGEVVLANTLLPTAKLGDAMASAIAAASKASALVRVKAELLASRTDAPTRRTTLAEASYGLDALVGRALVARLMPPMELAGALTQAPVDTFVAALGLVGPGLGAKDAQASVGALVSLGGDIVEVAADGSLLCNGVALGPVDPAAAARVASLSVEVFAEAFPEIQLRVAALDSAGKPVEGLGGALRVLEGDLPAAALVRASSSAAPRVLVVLDVSSSQPDALQNAESRRALGEQIGAALVGVHPDALVQVVGVGGQGPKLDGFTPLSSAGLGEAFAKASGLGSDLLGALADGAAALPSILVLLSDGRSTDSDPQASLAEVAGGAPVLAIHTSKDSNQEGTPLLQQIAALTGGRWLEGSDLSSPSVVSDALAEVLSRGKTAPYVLGYRAPVGGDATRKVTVSAGSVKAQATYMAPGKPGPRRALAGLYLRLSIDGREPIERTLAGWSRSYGPRDDEPLPVDLDAQIRGAARGVVAVAFEGGAPTYSMLLSEIVGGRLAWRAAAKALAAGDREGGLAALGEGGDPCLVSVRSLLAPFDAQVSAAHEAEGRVVIGQLWVGSERIERRLDLLPSGRLRASGDDAAASFRAAARATAQLALVEQAMGSRSTMALLAGKELKLIDASTIVDHAALTWVPEPMRRPFADLLERHGDAHRLVAADGSTMAFWAISPKTGAVLGVLPDGTGGVAETCDAARQVSNNAAAASNLGAFLGVPGAGAWAALGKAVGMAAIRAALAFDGAAGSGDPYCDIGKGLASEALGMAIPVGEKGLGGVAKSALTDALADQLPCQGQSLGGAC